MVKKINMKLALVLCVSALSFTANAQVAPKTKQATVEVSATVESNCEINAAPLVFGKYDPLSKVDTKATTAITLTCVKNTPVISVELSGLVGDTGIRQMSSDAGTLDYQVFKAGKTAGTPCTEGALSVWGSGNDALKPGIATDASAKNYHLCGVIAASQDVGAGEYKDTLKATVSY